MTKRLLAIVILSAIVLCGWGDRVWCDEAAREKAASEAYKQAREKRKEANTEERLAITKEFLAEFPESGKTATALDAVFYYQGGELGDMAGAIAYAERIRSKITDPEIAQDIDRELMGFYGKAGMTQKMRVFADRLGAAGVLDYSDHWNIIESAVDADDWQVARDYCAAARGMATAEVIRAERPDRDISDEDAEAAADERMGMLLVKDGWARANLGQIDAALIDFAKADNLVPHYYFGVPEYDLNLYWGRTLIMKGDFKTAIGRLDAYGLILRNEEALTALEEAYTGLHGSDSGYKDWVATHHRSIATTIDDFEMPDYKGERQRFSEIRSDVTLVSLWFPT